MSAHDPADLARVIDLTVDAEASSPCPSCGSPLPRRRRYCTDHCRTALHRIRRAEADMARLRGQIAAATDAAHAAVYRQQLELLELRAAERHDRLLVHRHEAASPGMIDLDAQPEPTDVTG